jgi:hypothetical protein
MTASERFWLGLGAGAVGAGVTWWVSNGHVSWTVAVGVILAVLIWCGEFLDELIP